MLKREYPRFEWKLTERFYTIPLCLKCVQIISEMCKRVDVFTADIYLQMYLLFSEMC